jgi:hypothetical protein
MIFLRILCVSVVVLLLSGCVAGDPYAQIAAGQAALQATAVAKQVSAERTRGAISALVLEQTQMAGEALALEAQARGTQEAIEYQQTSVAMRAAEIALQDTRAASNLYATQAEATAQMVVIQGTIVAGLRNSYFYATQTAIPVQAQLAVAAAWRENRVKNTWTVLFVGLVVVLLAFLGVLVSLLFMLGRAAATERLARARYIIDSAAGKGQIIDHLPADPPPALNDGGRSDVIELLYQSAGIVGSKSTKIPADHVIGWSPKRWTDVTNVLVNSGAVMKVDRVGTHIKLPWRDIEGLYQAVASGKLRLVPLPTGSVSWRPPGNRKQNRNSAPGYDGRGDEWEALYAQNAGRQIGD